MGKHIRDTCVNKRTASQTYAKYIFTKVTQISLLLNLSDRFAAFVQWRIISYPTVV